jgi:hypothetical protein
MQTTKQKRGRGRPRTVRYVRASSLLPHYVEALRMVYQIERVLRPLYRIKHDVLKARALEAWEDEHGEKHEVLETIFHRQGIQCSTCGVTFQDPEFTIDDEKFEPKLRIGRLIMRLPCGHRMDIILPKTLKFQQVERDRWLKTIGWTPDKSCELESGVPTVRTVKSYMRGLTEEDLSLIYKLRGKDK